MCDNLDACDRNKIFCSSQNKCTKVGCKCSMINTQVKRATLQGVPCTSGKLIRPYPRAHAVNIHLTQTSIAAGELALCLSQVFGLNRGSPRQTRFLNQGVCVYRTPDREYIKNIGQNNFTETVCMTDDKNCILEDHAAENLCDDQLKGVCMAGASRNGCTCRQNPQKHKLFTGLSCEQPCEGLCEMNGNVCEPLAAASRAGAKFGSSLIANKCPCHNTNCSKTPSSPDCFANLYPCSRAGFCSGGSSNSACECHRLRQIVASTVGLNVPLVMADSGGCEFKCPHSNDTAWHNLIEYFETNYEY